jgi:hypothetical protein
MKPGKTVRDSLIWFVGEMEERLEAKDMQRGERGWLDLHPLWLFLRMGEHFDELRQDLMRPTSVEDAKKTCVDIANEAMMLAEVLVSQYNLRMKSKGVKERG